MIDSDTGKKCTAAQESLVHAHGSATGNHLLAVLGKSILPADQKQAVKEVYSEMMQVIIDHPTFNTSGEFFLLEELTATLFESFRDFNGKLKSLA